MKESTWDMPANREPTVPLSRTDKVPKDLGKAKPHIKPHISSWHHTATADLDLHGVTPACPCGIRPRLRPLQGHTTLMSSRLRGRGDALLGGGVPACKVPTLLYRRQLSTSRAAAGRVLGSALSSHVQSTDVCLRLLSERYIRAHCYMSLGQTGHTQQMWVEESLP